MSLPKDTNCARAKDDSRATAVETVKEYLVIVMISTEKAGDYIAMNGLQNRI